MKNAAITLAAVPKAFQGHVGTIQRNALGSWRLLQGVAQIILVGDEEGVSDAAAEFGAVHLANIPCDEEGAPLLDAVLHAVDAAATTEWICYVNADIVLLPEFWNAAQLTIAQLGPALSVSRRWNLDVPYPIVFDHGWSERLRRAAWSEGELFTPFGLDVFVYPRGLFTAVPPFSIGAFSWDNWLVHEARRRGLPVVDLTAADGVIHQNHDYRRFASAEEYRRSPRAQRNFWLAGDSVHGLSSAADATHVLRDGQVVPADIRTVSVVICDSGGPNRLAACLAAFEYQTYPRTYTEVIVAVESGRTAPNDVLADYPFAKRVRATSPGRAGARNKGAAVARGELLAFLDGDVLPDADWVEGAVRTLAAEGPQCVVASTPEVRLADGGSVAVGHFEAISFHRPPVADRPRTAVGDGIMLDQAGWRAVGPFDEQLSTDLSEGVWIARAAGMGYPVVRAPIGVRRTLHGGWHQLTARVRQRARSELALAQLQSPGQRRTRSERWRNDTRRLLDETSPEALQRAQVPARARWGVRAAAAWAWLVRLDESIPDRRLPSSVRRRTQPREPRR